MGSSTTDESRPLRVAIVGGGIGGVLLAIGLQKHGHIDYQLYEAAPSFGDVGLGVSLGPNAQNALGLIDPRARAVLDRLGSTNMWESHMLDFVIYKCAYGPRADETICAQKTEVPIRTVHRARLLEGLVELVADQSRCHFTKRLATISQTGGGRGPYTLHFADGSTAEADVVMGADGVHSAVRKYVLGEDHLALRPQFSGAVAYRGVIPMERVVARLGEEVAQNMYCHFGRGVMTMGYPIEQGKLVNFVCVDVARGGEVGEQWMWPSKVDEIREKVRGFSDAVQG
ncbi:hypothetical protein MMC17_000244, partial [Xylographa soralifera]|nr:hypothetical protein [Xylographa soralifera]